VQPGELEKNISSLADNHSVLLSWTLPGDTPPGQRAEGFRLEVWIDPAKTDLTLVRPGNLLAAPHDVCMYVCLFSLRFLLTPAAGT